MKTVIAVIIGVILLVITVSWIAMFIIENNHYENEIMAAHRWMLWHMVFWFSVKILAILIWLILGLSVIIMVAQLA